MQTETAKNSRVWPTRTTRAVALVLVDRRAMLLLLVAMIATFLAYQARPVASIAVGWFGDRLFLDSSEGLGNAELAAGRWFGDELTDTAPTQRSRWTRGRALIILPGLAARDQATLTFVAQGWPADVEREPGGPPQPTVSVTVNGVAAGSFSPSVDWQEHTLLLPTAALQGGDLRVELESSTFTSTASGQGDPRPKGVRIARISVAAGEQQGLSLPPAMPVGLLALSGVLAFASLARMLRRLNAAFVLAALLVGAVALGFVVARIWTVALLPGLVAALLLTLLVSFWGVLWTFVGRLAERYARPGIVAAGLAAALSGWLGYLAAHILFSWNGGRNPLMIGLLLAGALAFVLLGRFRPTVQAVDTVLAAIATRRGAAILLTVFLAAWLGYEAVIIATLQGAGHADYSDNAVVARNLLRGRGWLVDYVTQFYQLVPNGVTRPQETWPLMQPVWIVPFFALFGVSDWAAKLPNLLFTLLLGVLVYRFGARVWDRRVGLTAAVFLLTSYLFFLLVINVTSDLAFVTLSFAVLALVYERGTKDEGRTGQRWLSLASGWWPVVAGVVTGLMMLQKPANGVFLAFGAGLWLLWRVLRPVVGSGRQTVDGGPRAYMEQLTTDDGRRTIVRRLAPLAVWTLSAVLVLSPYLARNMLTFGKLFYSTESKDAWVLEYAPEWDWIYRIYTPEQGLSETEGLPDRSWILRWGFDRTLAKMTNQVKATRDYLTPPWFGLPNGWSDALSGFKDGPSSVHPERDDGRVLFAVGAWLSFLGLLLALRRRASLVALVGLAFAPYTLFLVAYWHANEERYFVALMPWLALFAALALWRVYDAIASLGRGRFSPLALMVALVLGAQVVGPSLPEIGRKLEQWHYADSDRLAYAWLRENTATDDVVMTRVPWQLNWHSERPALMIPATTSQEKLFAIARHYNARYLVFDVGQRPKPATQRLLQCLVDHPEIGFSEAYVSPVLFGTNPTIVYQFPDLSRTLPERCP